MKLTTLLLIVTLFNIEASTYSQNTKITLKLDNVTVKEAFNEIESLSKFKFLYNHNKVDENRILSIDVKKERISDILKSMFSTTNIYFVVKKKQIILKTGKVKELAPPKIVKVQQQKIAGIVVDENGNPLPGVNIFVEGTDKGTATDFDGNFEIDVEKGSVLKLSFVGYESQFVTIGDQSTLNIQMEVDASQLEEVVVTALGITRKKASLGYSTTNLAGADIATIKQSNVINGLAGKVAGIVITPSSAGMGGSSRVILRGSASIQGGNQPLYVVDGIPINNSGFGTVGGGNKVINSGRTDYGSGISDLNPDDIESMSVLKGPNAAALYGARAANGVIMITTKSGKKGTGLGVSFTSNVMVTSIMEETLPKFQNEYGQGSNGVFDTSVVLENWGSKFDGSTYTTVKGLERTYSAQPNNVTDYFNTGIEAVNTITLQGGSDNASVRFSYSNFHGEGVLPNSTLGKNNFNLRAKVDLSDKLSIDTKVTYFTQEASNRAVQGWSDGSVSRSLYQFIRNVDLRDFDDYGDEFTGTKNPYKTFRQDNVNWIQYKNLNDDFRKRTQGFAKITYKFNENFSAFARIGTDDLTQRINQIIPFGHWISPRGRRSDRVYNITETNADFLLMFNKEYDNFSFNLNTGGNYRHSVNDILFTDARDFKLPSSTLYTNAEIQLPPSQGKQRDAIYSLYFSGEIGYKEMAYLSVTGRNDWDSRMWTENGESSDYSFFYPSVSLSLLGNKILGIDDGFVSFSKLRLSYAEVGSGSRKNDRISYRQSSTAGYFNTISVSRSSVFDDPNLVPERTKSVEVGLELKLFKNRLYTDFSYYTINTFDQILNAPVDPSTGFSFVRTNIGEISNKGFEFLIGGTPIQTDDFYWDISFNIAKNESTLESYIEGSDSYLFTSYQNFNVKTKVDGQVGDIYGRNFVYNDGNLVVDNNGLPVVSEEEFLGNYQADFTGGLSNTFSYKNLKFSFLIDFRQGGEAFSFTERNLKETGTVESTLAFREGTILDAVVNTGTDAAPNFVANSVEINSQGYFARLSGIDAAHMYDLSNARLRELTLAYSFPSEWLENTFISKASLSFVGRNLFFFYKHIDADPETSVSTGNNGQGAFYFNLPSTRSLGFNLNISF